MNKTVKLLTIFTIGMLLVISIPKLFFDFYFYNTNFQIPDLFDLFLTTTFSILMFYLIFQELSKQPRDINRKVDEKFVKILLIISFFLYIEGHGMHFAANSIHNLIENEGMDNNIYQHTEFIDEIFSHKFIFLGLFGMIIGGVFLQLSHPYTNSISNSDSFLLIIIGFLYGSPISLLLIEGHSVEFVFLGFSSIFIYLLYLIKKKKIEIKKYPFIYFIFITCIFALIIAIIWGIAFHGFREPSEFFP